VGLTVYYDWKVKTDLASARRMIVKFRRIAQKLPFDEISDIYEQDAPDKKSGFRPYKGSYPQGDLYLPRVREDGVEEVVHVPPLHAVFFYARVIGAETVSVGLASHPPVVIHREDVVKRNGKGAGVTTYFGKGRAIEFPTRRRGYYSWHSCCKTQYAGNPTRGGEANFLRAHLSLIELLDQIAACGVTVRIRDDSRYAKHRDVNRLLRSLRDWNALVARVTGAIQDALGDQEGTVVAPITDRPDFEHLEARGIGVLKRMAARQLKRKKKGPPKS
jgi:hypothetical protein